LAENYKRLGGDENDDHGEDLASQTREIIDHLYDDAFLNECYKDLNAGHVQDAVKQLTADLDERRSESTDIEWTEFLKFCRLHPLMRLLHQDPFSSHAFQQQKQRKYGGDPELLDMIHRVDEGVGPPDGTSEMGKLIFEETIRAPACEGIRIRTRKVAEAIDRIAAERQDAKILSVAVGYLHEAGLSQALMQRRIRQWVAVDSEPASLEEVSKRYGQYGVETASMTFKQLVEAEGQWKDFDLAFSTGLLEHLGQSQAQRLTTKLFESLRSGGVLLISNFPENLKGLGYMECFMDLHSQCRSRSEMMDLVAEIDETQIRNVGMLDETSDRILILQVTRD
jgi:2-polyprenyl-3-methyl-5-hydroxy-6-metoxy-1,4-benzoquinol methylase